MQEQLEMFCDFLEWVTLSQFTLLQAGSLSLTHFKHVIKSLFYDILIQMCIDSR